MSYLILVVFSKVDGTVRNEELPIAAPADKNKPRIFIWSSKLGHVAMYLPGKSNTTKQ